MDIGPTPDQSKTEPEKIVPHEAREGGSAPARRGWSRRAQLLILAVMAGVFAVLFLLGPALLHVLRPETAAIEETAPSAAATGSFKPTESQWDGLKIAPVKLVTFRTVQETDGKIALDDDLVTPVFSPYSGRVAKLFAKAGDVVQAGTPLLAVDASEFVQGQNDLITAVAGLTTARAQLRLAETSEARQHALYQQNAGALKDWQQSQVDLATAQGGLNTAEIAVAAVRNRLRILGKTDKEIAALETAANTQRFNPSAIVVSPIPGTVTQRQVGLGQNIVNQASGGSNPVFSIGDLSRVWLVANVTEDDSPRVHVGAPVEVRVSAFPGRVFKARVSYVAPSIDPNTHRLLVHAEVDNQDGALKPEMFASFGIVTGDDVAAPGVPDSAVVYEGDKARVFVADPNAKTVAVREIAAGRTSDGLVEVRSGLKPGESIVTSGALFIDRAISGD